jgi:hypothetical protein
MMGSDAERAGVLVLRAWVEDTQALRVRITRVVGCEEPMTIFATNIDGTCAVVRAWLEDVLETRGTSGQSSGRPPQ